MSRYILTCDEWESPYTLGSLDELKMFFSTQYCSNVIDTHTSMYLEDWESGVWKPLCTMPTEWLSDSD